MNLKEIKDLIAVLESSKLKKLSFKKADFEIVLEKEDSFSPLSKTAHSLSYHREAESSSVLDLQKHEESSQKVKKTDGIFVHSPMVGTFYACPAPDQPSFVKIGDRVEKDTIVCVIEAMKVMNEVKSGVAGIVKEILLDTAHPVEFGTKLFRIE